MLRYLNAHLVWDGLDLGKGPICFVTNLKGTARLTLSSRAMKQHAHQVALWVYVRQMNCSNIK